MHHNLFALFWKIVVNLEQVSLKVSSFVFSVHYKIKKMTIFVSILPSSNKNVIIIGLVVAALHELGKCSYTIIPKKLKDAPSCLRKY